MDKNLDIIAFFGLLAFIICSIAWTRGFFTLPPSKKESPLYLNVTFVFTVFAIFLATNLLLPSILLFFAHSIPLLFSAESLRGGAQIMTTLTTAILLFIYCKSKHTDFYRAIWKPKDSLSSILFDLAIGCITWVIAFPLVSAIGETADLLVLYFFGPQDYEQTAVQFLKESLHHPLAFSAALFTILLAAPLLEEFLFRGVLQTWLKKHLGTKAAILVAALFFAFFHFSPLQKMGNIPLTLSLFILGGFLGFIYERQRSLYASISLHSTFNAISTFRILFFPEG